MTPDDVRAGLYGEQIISIAREWVGTPFRHQGRTPGKWLDCAGLVVCLAECAGYKVEDVRGYSREPDGSLRDELERQLVPVRSGWQPADIILMKYRRDPRHLAIWTGETIIHAEAVRKQVIEHGINDRHVRRIIAVYRFPELAHV